MKKAFLLCCVFLLSGLLRTNAQIANNTSIVGTVSDPSGNVIAGATVVATEEQTRVHAQATTNGQGYYAITFIQPGTYDISVQQKGFSSYVKKGVIVTIDLASRADVALTVGSEQTTVEVSASTPPLITDDATLAETFSQKTIEEIPLSSHNALDVASASSNVFIGSKTSYSGNPPGEDIEGGGQREIQNSLTLDGVSIMNNLITTTPAHPPADTISAVQVLTGNYSAQYGSYLGVHVNMTTKNGTNQLHGAAYDYVENTALNALPFTYKPSSTSSKPVLHFNQFGINLGGPVFLPKLYDGRNKTFFFGSYEEMRQIGQSNSTVSSITPAMEGGDFSAICSSFNAAGACTSGTQIYDPSTGAPYANNQIPSSELNTSAAQIARNYEKYMVAPNLSGYANNLNTSYPSDLIIKQSIDRIDENIGEKVKLFFRYYWENLNATAGTPYPANASFVPSHIRNFAIGYTHIITPNLVNDIYLGVNKVLADNLNYWYETGQTNAGTSLGIPGFDADTLYNNPGVPVVSIDNFQGVGNAGSNWFQDDRTYDLYEQLSWTHGRHNIMAGAELRRLTLGREATNNPLGAITFSATSCTPNATTGDCAGPLTSSGYSAADFVLGYINNDTTPIDTIKGSVGEWRDGFFLLDNWQASQRLTLNLGFRYDLPTAPYSLNGYGRELNDAQTALIPTSGATLGANYTPTPGFKFSSAQLDNFGPRFGLNYRITDRTVFRGGFGMFYNPNQLNTYTLLTSNYPFAAAVSYTTSAADALTLDNPTSASGTASPVAGVAGTYVAAYTPQPDLKTQRSYQWNATVGQNLWNGAAFEIQYLGSHSLHLDRSFYNNEPLHPVSTAIESLNAQRPNQLFGSIRTFQEDEYSHYNAMTAVLRQRPFHHLSGQVSYTWSHDLDLSADSNNGGTTSQQYNIGADYGNANWDIRNRFVAVAEYSLPTFVTSNLLVRETAGGWHLSTLINVQSGTPYTVSMSSSLTAAGVDQGTERPSWSHREKAGCSLKSAYSGLSGNTNSCIDTSAYIPAVNYSDKLVGYGNIHRNSLIGPGFQYENLAVFKDFPTWRDASFQFRAEAFNLFNHPSGANPTSSGLGISTSGACATNSCLTVPSGFGQITSVQSVPGSFSGARVLELSGKLFF
ncbi:carboxypeptidase regulatory-like domain-containing protein [Silvibacterium sp.]|uniref:TonB-dependent receptor n=1 Tax=Silvibacterium sp. TaxID=1964179 RepID=UPI0039E40F9F